MRRFTIPISHSFPKIHHDKLYHHHHHHRLPLSPATLLYGHFTRAGEIEIEIPVHRLHSGWAESRTAASRRSSFRFVSVCSLVSRLRKNGKTETGEWTDDGYSDFSRKGIHGCRSINPSIPSIPSIPQSLNPSNPSPRSHMAMLLRLDLDDARRGSLFSSHSFFLCDISIIE